MADLKKLAEEIVNLTLLQAQELKTILKDEYGIEPAAGGAVMMAGPAGDAGGAAEEEKDEFDVILTGDVQRRVQPAADHRVRRWRRLLPARLRHRGRRRLLLQLRRRRRRSAASRSTPLTRRGSSRR